MKLGHKILSTLIASTILIGIISVLGLQMISSQLYRASESSSPKLEALLETETHVEDVANIISTYLSTAEEATKDEFYNMLKAHNRRTKKLHALLSPENEIRLHNEVDGLWTKYFNEGEDIINLSDDRTRLYNILGDKDVGVIGDFRNSTHLIEKTVSGGIKLLSEDIDKLKDPLVMISLLMSRRHEKDFILRKDPDIINKFIAEVANLQKKIIASKGFSDEEKDRALLLAENYKNSFMKLVDVDKQISQVDKELKEVNEKFLETGKTLDDAIEDNLLSIALKLIKDTEYVTNNTTKGIYAAILTGSLLVLLLSVMVSRSITRPINRLKEETVGIGKGDFYRRVNIESENEIGELAASFNHMMDQLQEKTVFTDQLQDEVQERELIEKELNFRMEELEKERSRALMISEDAVKARDEAEKAKISLQERELSLKNAQRIAHVGNWTWNMVNDSIKWSDETYRILGLKPQELEASNDAFLHFIHPDDRNLVTDAIKKALNGTEPYDIQHRIVQPDGKECIVHEQAEITLNDDSKPVLMEGTIQDITERYEMSAALEKAKNEAEAANIAKSEFLSSMSHEIRTPINIIIGLADIMADMEISTEQKDYIKRLNKAGEGLLYLINSILDLSKIEAGHLELYENSFNLSDIIAEAESLLGVLANEKGLKLSYNIEEDLPDAFVGDSRRLSEIIFNLVSNAIKFTAEGKVDISVRKLGVDDNKAELEFSVRDTGIGIPKRKLDIIFDRFTQADSSTTRNFGGTGLGTTISKKFVEMMDGRIWVESTPGEGSTFYFTIKLKIDNSAEIKKDIINKKRVKKSKGKNPLKILIADDSEDNRILFNLYMKGSGHEFDMVENGREALEKFRSKTYDIVLMDMEMPVMDGNTATKEIRKWEAKEGRKPKAIVSLTAHALKEFEQKSADAGANGHLTKPIKKEEFLDAISAFGYSD